MLPSHRRGSLGCQLSLVAIAPFVPTLPLFAQHIRDLAVAEIRHNFAAASGRSPRWQRCWNGPGWKGQTLIFPAANRAWPTLVCSGPLPVQALARGSGLVQTD